NDGDCAFLQGLQPAIESAIMGTAFPLTPHEFSKNKMIVFDEHTRPHRSYSFPSHIASPRGRRCSLRFLFIAHFRPLLVLPDCPPIVMGRDCCLLCSPALVGVGSSAQPPSRV